MATKKKDKPEELTSEEVAALKAEYDEAIDSTLDEDQRARVDVLVEAAPAFKPVKALSASGKMEFAAAVAALEDLQSRIANAEYSQTLVMAASAAMIDSCESALRLMAVSTDRYDAWSSSIDMDLIMPVIFKVFEAQNRLVGK